MRSREAHGIDYAVRNALRVRVYHTAEGRIVCHLNFYARLELIEGALGRST